MELTIRLFAGLRERAGTDELRVQGLPDSLDVAGLRRELEARYPELGPLDEVRGVIGTTWVADDAVISSGDELSLLPPVSGGAPYSDTELEAGVFEVSSEALDPQAVTVELEHPSCGAIVTFTGTTRETNRDQDVTRLEFEDFEELATAEMARIFEECRQRFDADDSERRLRMLVRHRRGVVEVGGAAVLIGVASPHRDTAFLACRFLIDQLKERVPFWKKEVYADGHHWIGESP